MGIKEFGFHSVASGELLKIFKHKIKIVSYISTRLILFGGNMPKWRKESGSMEVIA